MGFTCIGVQIARDRMGPGRDGSAWATPWEISLLGKSPADVLVPKSPGLINQYRRLAVGPRGLVTQHLRIIDDIP